MTTPLEGPAPRWFTIPAHRPFLTDLASGLLDALGREGLGEALVQLPSRRSAGPGLRSAGPGTRRYRRALCLQRLQCARKIFQFFTDGIQLALDGDAYAAGAAHRPLDFAVTLQ